MSESERISSRQSERVEGLRSGQDYAFEVKLNYQGYLLEVEDAHFHLDSAVLLPDYGQLEPDSDQSPDQNRITGLAILYACYRHAKEHPEQRALVVGHTDRSGSERYNQTLSELRARNVRCAIQGNRTGWVEVADEKHTVEDYQQILRWIAHLGWDCHPGPKDGKDGPKTRQGVRNFQRQYNQRFDRSIQVDGIVGPEVWGAFFEVYMGKLKHLMGTDEEGMKEARQNVHFLDCPSIGCGEHFPITADRRENYRDPVDRRVEILFFDPGEEPPLDCEAPEDTCEELYRGERYSFEPLPAEPFALPAGMVPVHIELAYIDPEEVREQRAWPTGSSVVIAYEDGMTQEKELGADGALQFHARECAFTLRFPDSASKYVAVSPPDSGESDKLIKEGQVETYHDDGWRVFKLPSAPKGASAWALPHSDWTAKGASNFEEGTFRDMEAVDRIGSEATPVQLVLDPHWLFVRFEFFDRVYGHSHHDDKRVSIPSVLLDGYRHGEASSSPDTRSNWMVFADKRERTCQALPWIVQRGPNGTQRPKPDSNVLLRFETSPDTFVVSEDEQTRRLEKVNDSAKLELGPERLKYYDMPEVWESQHYFTRLPKGSGRPFEDLTYEQIVAKVADPENPDEPGPLVFSLDDIVLTELQVEEKLPPLMPMEKEDSSNGQSAVDFDPVPVDLPDKNHSDKESGGGQAKLRPISWTPDDRAAIFANTFAKDGNANRSEYGLYKPDPEKRYLTKKPPGETTRNYIADYPNWTRLVVAEGMLFDVFNWRTPDDEEGPTGARAALQLPEDTGPSPGSSADSKTFSAPFSKLVTFFEQTHDDGDIGRFDMALLRCCDVRGGKEIAMNFQYFRYHYDFSPLPEGHPLKTDEEQTEFGDKAAFNIAQRWNGPDEPCNPERAEIVPEDPKHPLQEDSSRKLRVPVTWFVQVMEDKGKAHFTIEVHPDKEDGVRAYMSSDGTGQMQADENVPVERDWNKGRFTAAHESGHAGSLEDEYVERRDSASYRTPGFESNIPGDPYAYDKQPKVGPGGMMVNNKAIRARYFWHVAEWLRAIDEQSGNQGYFVQHGKYKYRLPPHHKAPVKSYVSIPLGEETWVDAGRRKNAYHWYLYPLGKDQYSQDGLVPGHTLDGIMVIVVKMEFHFPGWDSDDYRAGVNEVNRSLTKVFNERWYVTGEYTKGDVHRSFEKCALHVSPRFLVENHSESGDVAPNPNFVVDVEKGGLFDSRSVSWEWDGRRNRYKLRIVYNSRPFTPKWNLQVAEMLRNEFPRMLGLNKKADAVSASDLKVIARTGPPFLPDADVHTF